MSIRKTNIATTAYFNIFNRLGRFLLIQAVYKEYNRILREEHTEAEKG